MGLGPAGRLLYNSTDCEKPDCLRRIKGSRMISVTTRQFTVQPDQLASRVGSGALPVLSTPSVLAMLEKTAMEALLPYQKGEDCSVGIRVELEHLAPALEGAGLTCELVLQSWDGRKAAFDMRAVREDGVLLARGKHWRAMVQPGPIMARARVACGAGVAGERSKA